MNDVVATVVYLLCFLTSSTCAYLLGRSYRRTGARLLLWSSLCFVLLAFNNLVLVVDLLVLPEVDLRLWRLVFALAGVSTLLFGFIWDLEEDR
jgi:ABC-type glycerol-3-phosphate transport system permease component